MTDNISNGSGNKLFILSESVDAGITNLWYFRVDSKYEMALYIINHLHRFDEMFNGISWYSGLGAWRRSETKTPLNLLLAINDSHIDGDSESGFQIFEINLLQESSISQERWTYL